MTKANIPEPVVFSIDGRQWEVVLFDPADPPVKIKQADAAAYRVYVGRHNTGLNYTESVVCGPAIITPLRTHQK